MTQQRCPEVLVTLDFWVSLQSCGSRFGASQKLLEGMAVQQAVSNSLSAGAQLLVTTKENEQNQPQYQHRIAPGALPVSGNT